MGVSRKSKSETTIDNQAKEDRAKRLGIDPAELARQFCELDDELQADVFIRASERAKGWDRDQASQWFDVGRHLATCECATPESREMIRCIAAGIASVA